MKREKEKEKEEEKEEETADEHPRATAGSERFTRTRSDSDESALLCSRSFGRGSHGLRGEQPVET